MRKALVCLVALGTFAFIAAPAVAGTIKLDGTHTRDEIKTTCEKNGGTFQAEGGGHHAYGCLGKGGAVFCNKEGTCAGVCPNCGGKAAAGGTTGRGSVGGILTNATGAKAQPLQPQQVTTSPSRTPTRQVTRSPKTAQPMRAQKTTASPKTASPSSTGASPSLRRNSH